MKNNKMKKLSAAAQKQLKGGLKRKTDKDTCDELGGTYDEKSGVCTY